MRLFMEQRGSPPSSRRLGLGDVLDLAAMQATAQFSCFRNTQPQILSIATSDQISMPKPKHPSGEKRARVRAAFAYRARANAIT